MRSDSPKPASRLRLPSRGAVAAAATALALTSLAAAVPPAGARPPLETILQDDAELLHRPPERVAESLAAIKALGVDRVRITAGWSGKAPDPGELVRPQIDASDPDAYPRGRWDSLDSTVRLAHEAGLEVMIDIAFWAPLWATRDAAGTIRARRHIDAREYADFAKAVVRRYSGDFRPQLPAEGGGWHSSGLGSMGGRTRAEERALLAPLPRVTMWTIWNEPNHPEFMQPQWRDAPGYGLVPASPHQYRRLASEAYAAIKSVQPGSTVLVGALAGNAPRHPYSTRSAVPPLRFLLEWACVDSELRPLRAARCRGFSRIPGDGFSHHPYSRYTPPGTSDSRPGNVPIGDLSRLTKLLDELARRGRIDPALRRVYLTEYGYETNPPDERARFTPIEQARFLSWAEYLAWRNPRVRSFPQFLLRDLGANPKAGESGLRENHDWQSGLLFADGTPKPAATTFRLALFAECVGRRGGGRGTRRTGARGSRRLTPGGRGPRVRVWGRVRGQGGAFVRYRRHRPGNRYRLTHVRADGTREHGLALAPRGCPRERPGGARRRIVSIVRHSR